MKVRTMKIMGFFIFLALTLFCVNRLNNIYDHQVRQEVVANEHDIYDMSNRYYEMTPMISYRKDDGNIDSIVKKMWDESFARQREADRIWNAPYKLITSYNHHEVVVYGDAKYIDSVKCIHYQVMMKCRSKYDTQDSLVVVAKEKEAQAIEDKENELDRLNEKTCK